MVNVHVGPAWFFGVDAGLEAFAALIAFFVTVAALRLYRMTNESRYAYFTSSFALLTLSFLARAVTDFLLEDLIWHVPSAMTGKIFFYGYVTHIFLALAAYLTLFTITHKVTDNKITALLGLLLIPAMLVSGSYFISFYTISALFLAFITLAYHKNCKKVKTRSSCYVFYAFLFLTLAQIFFLFEAFKKPMYVAAHISQALGYLTLLFSLLTIKFKHRKK